VRKYSTGDKDVLSISRARQRREKGGSKRGLNLTDHLLKTFRATSVRRQRVNENRTARGRIEFMITRFANESSCALTL